MRSARPGNLAAAAAAVVLIAGCDSARRLEQRSEASVCARCHGFPPPAPHPQSTACEVCHSTTVVSGTQLVPGGAHANGQVDIAAHTMPYLAPHRDAALAGVVACTVCHGADYAGGTGPSCNTCHGTIGFADWRTNCTFCHGTRTVGWTAAQATLAAPPAAVEDGVVDPADRGVGAHQAHLTASTFANPVACGECHAVPADLGHVTQAVEMQWGPTASNGTTPVWNGATCANYCHGATLPGTRTLPTWAPPSAAPQGDPARPIACGDCHEANPTTGKHLLPQHSFDCNNCHAGAYTATVVDRSLHLNRTIDKHARVGWDPADRSCASACHANPSEKRFW
jgi:hypothetical protein